MKIAYNNNYSILPFYKANTNTQYPHLFYSFGDIYPLYIDRAHRLPFQIYEKDGAAPTFADLKFYLYDRNGNEVREIGYSQYDNDLFIKSLPGGGHVIVCKGAASFAGLMPIGQYYIKCVDSKNNFEYFSEFCCIVNDVTPYLKVEWRNVENFVANSATIIYENNYRNVVYLETELGKPEYQIQEEGEERDGHFFPTKQMSYKTFKATFFAPEYLLDAMRLIRLADIVKLTDRYGNEIYADTFLLTPEWQEQGNLAKVTIEVTTDTVAKKCGRAVGITTPLTLSLDDE